MNRLQVSGGKEKYGNFQNALLRILKEEGFSALYKGDLYVYVLYTYLLQYTESIGIVPRMVVVGPLFAITLLSFEMQKSYMIKNGLL